MRVGGSVVGDYKCEDSFVGPLDHYHVRGVDFRGLLNNIILCIS